VSRSVFPREAVTRHIRASTGRPIRPNAIRGGQVFRGRHALRGGLLEIAKHGRVLVLLDACHSGATTLDGASRPVDAADLRRELAAANVTVLTSSGGREPSLEDEAWQHGAFTRALLDALNDPAADVDRIGLINANALAYYVARRVSSLTGGKQKPAMEVRFDTTVFAVGL
jgi:uncharacterized caspase-like protein